LWGRSLAQLDDNLGALDVRLGPAQQARLAEVRAIELDSPRGVLRRLDLTRQTASARCGLGQQIGCVR
jgi:hypothetical protein